ncbi:MAG: VWA domain-containing protein [Pirellulaceae bacterium]
MPRWGHNVLNALFGDPSPYAGEGVEVSFTHTWPWPPWVTLLFLLGSAAYITTLYLKESGTVRRRTRLSLATLRILLIALLLTMMYGWMRDRYRTDLPDLVVVIDDSGSMLVADQYEDQRRIDDLKRQLQAVALDEATRVNLVKALLLDPEEGWLASLQERYNVKLYLLSASARIQSGQAAELDSVVRAVEADGESSRLGIGLQDILESQRGRPTAAIVLLTDGVTTEGKPISEVAHYARRKGIPLYILGVGDERPPRDLRLSDLLVDDAVFLGDVMNFDFKLSSSGFGSAQVTVWLKRQDSEELLTQQTLTVVGDTTAHSVRLSYRPLEEGEYEFVAGVEALENESNIENNRLVRRVRVRDETIRVLYVQEYPSPEFRYLKTLLERGLKRTGGGKAIHLVTVLQEADLEYVELDASAQRVFPVNREELFTYDVVIFGDVNPSYLSRPVLENLAAFVKDRGGGVVFIAGPRHTPVAYRGSPLEDLFPVDLNTVSLPDEATLLSRSWPVQPTLLGAASPHLQLADTPAANLELWRSLPPLRWFLQTLDTRLGARVLVETAGDTDPDGSPYPLIFLQFVGAGRVVFQASDESYLWSRYRGTDMYYERYWMQTIRYLSRSKLLGTSRGVELTSDRTQYFRGESVPLHVRFLDDRMAPVADDGVTVVVEQEQGRRQRIKLHRDLARRGVFEGSVSSLAEGAYRAWMATPTIEDQPPSDQFVVLPPPGEQARLAMDAADLRQAAKTSQGRFFDLTTAARLLDDLPAGRQVRIESLPSVPMWNSPALAGLFVLLLTSEWLLRRRLGWL